MITNLPPVRIAQNLKLIGHADLGKFPNAAKGWESVHPSGTPQFIPYGCDACIATG
jgi:hypothetical protein